MLLKSFIFHQTLKSMSKLKCNKNRNEIVYTTIQRANTFIIKGTFIMLQCSKN